MTDAQMKQPLMQVRGITKTYPGVQALKNVDFTLHSGQIHALIGVNGAGKSTLVRIIAGATNPDSGTIEVAGRELDLRRVADASHSGIVVVHQERTLIRHLTVAENIMLGAEPAGLGIIRGQALRQQALELLERFGLELDVDANVENLDAGKQQLVDIMRALRVSPKVLVLDEPTAALSAAETEYLFAAMRQLKAQGVGIIFVSHRLDEIFAVTDYLTILRDGEVVTSGATRDYQPEQIPSLMVGREVTTAVTETVTDPARKPLLYVSELSGHGFENVSMTVRVGEIVGLAGVVGAGRTELLESLIGFEPFASGQLQLRGEPFNPTSPQAALKQGVLLVPDERTVKGLLMRLNVLENLAVVSVAKMSTLGWVHGRALREAAANTVDRLGIITPSLDTDITSLSGGNKQKVVFGKWITALDDVANKMFIFNEPTEGVDVGGRADMWEMIRELARQGAGVLFSTSDMDELMQLSNRIYIMRHGHIVSSGQRTDFTQEIVLRDMLGADTIQST